MKYLLLDENNKVTAGLIKGIHEIPNNAIEVSEEIWKQRLNDSSLNCYENGKLIKKDFRTAEEIELENQAIFRAERDNLLKLTDIEINKAEDLGQDTAVLRAYRQALRDATIDWVMPESVF